MRVSSTMFSCIGISYFEIGRIFNAFVCLNLSMNLVEQDLSLFVLHFVALLLEIHLSLV